MNTNFKAALSIVPFVAIFVVMLVSLAGAGSLKTNVESYVKGTVINPNVERSPAVIALFLNK